MDKIKTAGRALVVVAVMSACGAGVRRSSGTTVATEPSTTAATSPVAPSPTTSTPAPTTMITTPTTVATNPPCNAQQLTVSAGQGGAGLGHVGFAVLFTNHGPASCTLFGYPGVAALDTTGAQAVQATRTPGGYLGGLPFSDPAPPTVTLGADQTASALIESTDNPVGTATSCPTFNSFLVTPPNTTTSVTIAANLPDCDGIQVHPVVPGSTGSLAN